MNETEHQKDEDTTTEVVPSTPTEDTEAVSTDTHEVEVENTPTETAAAEAEVSAPEAVPEVVIEAAATDTTTANTTAAVSAAAALAKSKEFLRKKKYTVATLALVLIALLALVYALEDKGKLNTGIFDGLQKQISKHTAAATVNGEKISEHDLDISVTQLSSGAAAQGADITDPAVQTEIRTQALEMLINTELLKQEAATRGISATEEDITARLETLKTDVGGEEVLNQRMAEFGINKKTLLRDIKNELTIQKLLDEVFKEKSVAVTEEEIVAFYDQAGGVEAGLPAIDEVRDQIEAQVKATKEQGVVTAYLEELRGKAEIKTL